MANVALTSRSEAERFEELFAEGKAKGLTDRAAAAYGALGVIGERYNVAAAPILSGKRSRFRNEALQLKWDLGLRSGLARRPAEESKHLDGDAFDLSAPAPVLRGYGHIARYLPGVRWGGNFTTPDLPHFDVGG